MRVNLSRKRSNYNDYSNKAFDDEVQHIVTINDLMQSFNEMSSLTKEPNIHKNRHKIVETQIITIICPIL